MISTVILLCAFECNYISNIFNHADHFLLTHAVGTNGTDIRIRNIMTALTKLYIVAHTAYHLAEMLYIVSILLQQMKHQAKGSFFADTWQFSELINRIFKQGRGELHSAQMYRN